MIASRATATAAERKAFWPENISILKLPGTAQDESVERSSGRNEASRTGKTGRRNGTRPALRELARMNPASGRQLKNRNASAAGSFLKVGFLAIRHNPTRLVPMSAAAEYRVRNARPETTAPARRKPRPPFSRYSVRKKSPVRHKNMKRGSESAMVWT